MGKKISFSPILFGPFGKDHSLHLSLRLINMRLEDNDVFHPCQKGKFKGLLREETNIRQISLKDGGLFVIFRESMDRIHYG